MEIERIEIFDFQSHHRTVLEPAPAGQLTVIVGPSDSGKTAIIRALRWLYYNTPQGTDFINVKTNTAKVAITFTDGRQVTRERHRKNYNRYNIFEGEKWHTYEGFGAGVPLEVQEVTGVRPVTIGDLELNLNLAEQLDGPFLGKSVSAGARAKVLGKLAGTEEVDYAAKQLNTDLYRRKMDEKNLAAEIKGLVEQIGKFSYLPAMAKRIADLENIVAYIKAGRERKQKLAGCREKLACARAGKEEARVVIDRWKHVELAEYSLATAEKAFIRAGTLKNRREKLAAVREGIRLNAGTVARWSGLEKAQAETLRASESSGRRRRLAGLKNALENTRAGIREAGATVARWKGVEAAREMYDLAVKASDRRSAVRRLKESLGIAQASVRQNMLVVKRWANLGEAWTELEKAAGIDAAVKKAVRLKSLLTQLRNAKRECEETVLRAARAAEAEDLVRDLEAAAVKRGKIINLAARLRATRAESRRAREAAVLWEQKVSELESAYRDELVMLGRCPLCGSDIDIQKLKEVI